MSESNCFKGIAEKFDRVAKNTGSAGEKDYDSDGPFEDTETYDEIKGDEGDPEVDSFEGFNGSGRTVTLQMLLSANVLQPGRAAMTIEYLGQKFVGDLLPDGKIKSHETETIFLSPSAWAMHCKRIINPEKKSGCGWASVKYRGKKLDAYKANWMRKCAQQNNSITCEDDDPEYDVERKLVTPPPLKRTVLTHNTITNRNIMHDANSLIETVPFSTINKLQPFLITCASSALLLADFHSHLTFHEVCGYLGGTWDVNSHTLSILKCYPCRNCRFDKENAANVENEIQKLLIKDQLILVGWYHTHPKFQAEPTLRDIDAQLDYQIKMRGPSDATYTPCVGLILSPYYENNRSLESEVTLFWVIPPPENRQMLEYGRPMNMEFTITPDNEVSENIFTEMKHCVEYYQRFRGELVDFKALNKDTTYLEMLKTSLYSKFPLKQKEKEVWSDICKLLDCEEDGEFVPPKFVSKICMKEVLREDLKEESKEDILCDLKIMSLQEQLALPSGLNMNPRHMSSPLVSSSMSSISNPVTIPTAASPRDSPITIPSNSVSPSKFELPIRASPSPAKSDTSSCRTRASPAPSPGKFHNTSDISRNSPSLVPGKCEHTPTSSASDVMAATVSSLSGQSPSNFIPGELNSFFRQQQKDFGSSSLNQLAATAAKVGNKSKTASTDHSVCEKPLEKLYSNNFNVPGVSKLEAYAPQKASKQDSKTAKHPPSLSYKTKLMKELEELKNDPIKISELMRSPEYAALLLQQAEALGATTLGTLGFGADFSFLGGNQTKKQQQQQAIDYTNLLHASKLLGYDMYMQQAKSVTDLNNFFQQQLGHNVKKQQSADYTTLLQTYSKLFDAQSPYGVGGSAKNVPPELAALLNSTAATSNNCPGSRKQTDTNSISNDMLNQLMQCDKVADLNSLLYHQSKASSDLNAMCGPAVAASSKSTPDPSAYYSQLTQEKMQDYAALFQQHHGKYGLPDPLSKSTLAANNMFMSPSALLKLQQDSLNSMIMKPPKSNASSSRARESSASPAQERLTPTKSSRGESPASTSAHKYNFSAIDLAISSVAPSNTPSPLSSDSGLRRPSETPPVDFSRVNPDSHQKKKRMEYSSIADLAAPPPAKQSKSNECADAVLNLDLV